MRLSNIPKFERSNPSLSINVIKYKPLMVDDPVYDEDDDSDVTINEAFDIVYKSGNNSAPHNYTLLLLGEKGNFHYHGVRPVCEAFVFTVHI